MIYCIDVIDKRDYVAGENEQECDDASYADDIKSDESVWDTNVRFRLELLARN